MCVRVYVCVFEVCVCFTPCVMCVFWSGYACYTACVFVCFWSGCACYTVCDVKGFSLARALPE